MPSDILGHCNAIWGKQLQSHENVDEFDENWHIEYLDDIKMSMRMPSHGKLVEKDPISEATYVYIVIACSASEGGLLPDDHRNSCSCVGKFDWSESEGSQIHTMSELLDGVKVSTPTVSRLYYLLGNISYCWEMIALKLGISCHQVERIKADSVNCNMRMIEAFDVWLSADVDCNWSKVIKVLNTLDQSLAEKVHHYIREVGRIEGSWQSRGFHCDWVKPLKNLSYDQWWLKETACQDDVLAHSSIEGFVLSCLSKYASKWYKLGIALQIPKQYQELRSYM